MSIIGESKSVDAIDELVRAVGGEFNGLKCVVCRKTSEPVIRNNCQSVT